MLPIRGIYSDCGSVPRSLRPHDERGQYETYGENDREPGQPTWHLGEDGCESLDERHDAHQHGAARARHPDVGRG
jgi:hypothetical protein